MNSVFFFSDTCDLVEFKTIMHYELEPRGGNGVILRFELGNNPPDGVINRTFKIRVHTNDYHEFVRQFDVYREAQIRISPSWDLWSAVRETLSSPAPRPFR